MNYDDKNNAGDNKKQTGKVTRLFETTGNSGETDTIPTPKNPDDTVVTVLKDVAIYPDKRFLEDIKTAAEEISSACVKITTSRSDVYFEFDAEKFAQEMNKALAAKGFNNRSFITSVCSRDTAEELVDPCADYIEAPELSA